MENYEQNYKESKARMQKFLEKHKDSTILEDSEIYEELSEIFPELEDERIKNSLIDYLKEFVPFDDTGTYVEWLEKQNSDKLMRALQEANKRIGELVEENYHLKEPKMTPKWLYRLEYMDDSCGLWYNGKGEWCFESGIGSIDGCKTKSLPMEYDERYKQDGRDWFSSCSRKEDLLHWYSLEDARKLLSSGFVFTRYLATEYHEYNQQTVFIKDTALYREEIDIFELFGQRGSWSENDDRKVDAIIGCIRFSIFTHPEHSPVCEQDIEWLKSLKNRFQVQWSEEDRKMLNNIIETYDMLIGDEHLVCEEYLTERDWLKSIRNKITSHSSPDPKFKIGDWIVNTNSNLIYYVESILLPQSSCYCLKHEGGTILVNLFEQDCYHLWTINDSKPGDILTASDGSIFLYNGLNDKQYAKYYVSISSDRGLVIGDGIHCWETARGCSPATKEQCDLLFNTIKENGYEWNSEKLELKKIKQKSCLDGWPNTTNCLHNCKICNAKCLYRKEERVYDEQKSAEWSKEDEAMINNLYRVIDEHIVISGDSRRMFCSWLKSLKERHTWKPSDKQMEAVKRASNGSRAIAENDYLIMESLYNDLKKL